MTIMSWLDWRKHCLTAHSAANAEAVLYHAIRETHADLVARLDRLEKGEQKEMVALTDLAAVEAAERGDLITLTGLVTQILTAVAQGSLDQAAAQKLLDAMNVDDATVKSNISAIQAALTPAPPPADGGATPPAA